MDPKTLEIITRLFVADAGEAYEEEYATLVGELRDHLETTGQWDWDTYAAPLCGVRTTEGK